MTGCPLERKYIQGKIRPLLLSLDALLDCFLIRNTASVSLPVINLKNINPTFQTSLGLATIIYKSVYYADLGWRPDHW
jgi:hypothetical protein